MPTKIQWADETWNPVTGCSSVSEGCTQCYARRMSKRLAGRFGYPANEPFRVTVHWDRIDQPMRWRKPRRVFVCSMGDIFHEDVPGWARGRVWNVMEAAHEHTFMVLTKRPQGMKAQLEEMERQLGYDPEPCNVWLGVSAENQKRADERIPLLQRTPAAKRFVSLEPLLGPIDLDHIYWRTPRDLPGQMTTHNWLDAWGLDWVIVGAETGPGARPMDPDWARDIRDQCKAAGVSFFFKAMSGRAPIPDDLMIREFPE